MAFTDIFIKRPVLATVVSLFILLLGLRAMSDLNVRQYPELQNAVITVSTVYVGADADLVRGFITTPLEKSIASAEGIEYLSSASLQGVSSINAFLRLDADPNEVLTQIASKVDAVRSDLPEGSEEPAIVLAVGETTAAMYLSFFSDVLDNNQITDYLVRVVQPKLSTVPGVQSADVLGGRTFAMRIWLDPERLAASNVTASEVYAALRSNNVLAAVGATKGSLLSVNLTASTDLSSRDDFAQLIVRQDGDALVRLQDVATIEQGAESYATSVSFNGQNATFMGISVAPDANLLDVIGRVRDAWPQIKADFPQGLEAKIPYDSTRYIEDAISEVQTTLIEALIIVIVVIFLFLGSLRAVIVPAIAVPLSLVGGIFLMLLMGFSINLLTLLAMVLAIGMVVDDAIIVLENVHRHVEEGMQPMDAALKGARELAGPIVAMTLTLVAVYAPIGFLGGLTGALFIEFAFTLAGAVLISGVVALTLSPVMCAKLLKPKSEDNTGRFEKAVEAYFGRLEKAYERRLHGALNTPPVLVVFGLIVLVSCYFLYVSSPTELAPQEDQGVIFMLSEGAPNANLDYTQQYTEELFGISKDLPEVGNYFLLNGVGAGGGAASANQAISGMVMKPWSERDRTTPEVFNEVNQRIAGVSGLKTAAFMPPALPSGGQGFPVEFVIGAVGATERLKEVADQMVGRAFASGKFIFAQTDLKINRPQSKVVIDRERAASLGLSMQDIAGELSAMLSGGYVNRYSQAGRSYKVVPQVQRSSRLNPEQLLNYRIRTASGELVPLSTVVSLKTEVQPQSLNRFQQLDSATISGVPRPGVPLGEAIAVLEQAADELFPPGFSRDYGGQTRQFKNEGSALVATFFFAIIVIYLVLAAQFESFRDPLIILVTVPMSICGALIFVSLGLTTVNIYTQVGLVTLIGVIAKHGILIVEFANQLQREGHDKRAAVEKASAIRLRPVLMTTAALVIAMVPLLIASGPGAAARFAIGLVIATGMTIGTAFTLFVLPAVYLYLGQDLQGKALETPAQGDDDDNDKAALEPQPAS